MKKNGAGILLFILLLMLTACTSNNQEQKQGSPTASPNGGKTAAPASEQPKQSPAAQPGFPREVESAGGNITIKERPAKVALASWQLLEMLLPFDQSSAGITVPFAAANSALSSDVLKPYADKFKEIKVIGENTKVNLETLLAYGPDLIVAGSTTNKAIKEQLEQIAPTVWIDEEKINVRNEWPKVVTLMGSILGQEERAKTIIDDFTAKQSEGKGKLAARKGETVLFVQVREKAVYVMPPSTLARYYEGLDLTSPPSVEKMTNFEQLTLEGLSQIDPDHIFLGYFNYTDKSLAALTDEWEKSQVWKSLKAVKNNHVYPINGELALGLGPIGQKYGLETVIEGMK
ncbi:ABC transporter substrate-binding protein [Paenibacillus contaminans]|nr:ABC transporter substrate-binding protein [Paenibacillus contaminans]